MNEKPKPKETIDPNNNLQEQTPPSNRETTNSNSLSEVIAKILLEKFISIAVRKSITNKIEKSIGDHCFYFIKTTLHPLGSQLYILYDRDDTIPQPSSDIFFESSYAETSNTWIEINEPQIPEIDRTCSDLIKKGTLTTSTPKETIEETIVPKIERSTQSRKTTKRFSIAANSQALVNMVDNVVVEEKKRKDYVIDLPCYDIEVSEVDNEQEIYEEQLREEMQKEIVTKQIEEKKKVETEKREKIVQEKGKQKLKDFDAKKFTFDADGNVIEKKKVSTNSLAKEFYWSKMNIKQINEDKGKKVSPKRNKKSRKNIKPNNIPEEEVIFNPNTKTNIFQVTKPKPKEQLITAGSSYHLIFPEIGVRVTENKSSKGGNKDFHKVFNKTSSHEYNQMLNEYIPRLNKSLINSKVGGQGKSLKETEINPLLTSSNSNEILNENNPLLTEPPHVQPLSTLSHNISSMPYNSYNTLSNPHFTRELDRSIRLNNRFSSSSSLKIAIESVSNLAESEEFGLEIPKQTKNVFAGEHRRLFKESGNDPKKELNNINKFNSSLIKSDDWGKERHEKSNLPPINMPLKSGRLKERAYLTELGISIMHTKLPRSRKYNHYRDTNSAVSLFKI